MAHFLTCLLLSKQILCKLEASLQHLRPILRIAYTLVKAALQVNNLYILRNPILLFQGSFAPQNFNLNLIQRISFIEFLRQVLSYFLVDVNLFHSQLYGYLDCGLNASDEWGGFYDEIGGVFVLESICEVDACESGLLYTIRCQRRIIYIIIISRLIFYRDTIRPFSMTDYCKR